MAGRPGGGHRPRAADRARLRAQRAHRRRDGRPRRGPRRVARRPSTGDGGQRPGAPPAHDRAGRPAGRPAPSWRLGGGTPWSSAGPQRADRGRVPGTRRPSVLVLEQREQLGGACTLDRPFTDDRFVVSPCAYLVGLLHPLVDRGARPRRYGYRTFPVDPRQWTPFEDGTSLTHGATTRAPPRRSPRCRADDVDGFLAYDALFAASGNGSGAARSATRGSATRPDRAALEELFADDPEALDVSSTRSIADVVEHHVRDERLRTALHGQGVIGTFAGPRDPGTAWVHAHHRLGLAGRVGLRARAGWAGSPSASPTPPARRARCWPPGSRWRAIEPGVGVRLAGGELVRAPAVVSQRRPDAHPRRWSTGGAPARRPAFAPVADWRSASPVVRSTARSPGCRRFPPPPDRPDPRYRAQVEIASRIDATQAAFERGRGPGTGAGVVRALLPDAPTTRPSRRRAPTR